MDYKDTINLPKTAFKMKANLANREPGLVQAWESCFQRRGLHTAQVLLTHDDLADRKRYLNARSTLRTLLDYGVVPIVNENDTVVTDEIRFGDNDTLGALVAFAAASAMPLNPHIKNRSRAQEVVVAACLELDQPQRAQRYIEQIANWRRGAGYADLAFHQAQQGRIDQVEPQLELHARDDDVRAPGRQRLHRRAQLIQRRCGRSRLFRLGHRVQV